MKKNLALFILVASLVPAGMIQAQLLRVPIAETPTDDSVIIKTIYLSPSVGIDMMTREGVTGITSYGAVPTAGYGIKWNPQWWQTLSNSTTLPFLSLDLFVELAVINDTASHANYTAIDLLPVITIMDWVAIGFGERFDLGAGNTPSRYLPLFTLGIHKGL